MKFARLSLITLAVVMLSGCSARSDVSGATPNRNELLRNVMARNWFVRVITESDTSQGRVRQLTGDSIRLANQWINIGDIRAVERRVPLGDTGSKKGALIAGGIALITSVLIRPGLESFAETKCDFQCSVGLHLFFPGAFAIIGGLVGDAVVENRYEWVPVGVP